MSSSCLLPFVLWLTKATSVTCRYLLRSWQGTWTGSRTEASPAHREQRRVPGQAGRGRVAAGVVGRECGRFGKYRAAALFATSLVSVRLRHAPFFCWSSERREGGTCGEVQGGMIRLRTIWVVYLSFICRLLCRKRSIPYEHVVKSSSDDRTDQDRTAVSIPG